MSLVAEYDSCWGQWLRVWYILYAKKYVRNLLMISVLSIYCTCGGLMVVMSMVSMLVYVPLLGICYHVEDTEGCYVNNLLRWDGAFTIWYTLRAIIPEIDWSNSAGKGLKSLVEIWLY